MRVDLPALPETRGFALRLRDELGLQSRSLDLARPPLASTPEGQLFLMAVGTDRHDHPALAPLHFAVADARNLAAALTGDTVNPYYRAVRAEVMADDPDLARALPERLAALTEGAAPSDTLILNVAGHGMLDGAGRFHLASRAGGLAETALDWAKVARTLTRFPGRALVLRDACHSGAAEATNDDAVAGLGGEWSYRGDLRLQGTTGKPGAQLIRGRALHLRRGGGEEPARQATDLDGNGTLELDELYARVKSRVVADSQGLQTPWIARKDAPGAIPIH